MTEQNVTVGVVGLGSVGQACVELLTESGIAVIAADSDPAAVAGADLVIEAVPEDEEIKASVLRAVAASCSPDTVLISTTATLSLASLAAASGRPTRLVGLRFLVPPGTGTGFELMTTTMTDPDAADAAKALLARLPLRQRELGHAHRLAWDLLLAYLNRSVALYEAGYATREDIDTAMRLGCGLPSGPLALLDRIGLDVAATGLTDLHQRTGRAAHAPAGLLSRMVDDQHFGAKVSRGIYAYTPSGELASAAERIGLDHDVTAREVTGIGLVGSGTMARGIAQVTSISGLDTVLVARTKEKADAAIEAIDASMVRAVRRGQITPDQRRAALTNLHPSCDFEDLADRDVVVEAVAEDDEVKAEVFAQLDGVCRPGTIFTTTTSSLSVTDCAEATERRADVVGMHFFNPAPAMMLVEVCRTEFVSEDVLATAHALARRLGKTPVDCSDRAGFIVNYLLFPYLNDAVRLVESGVATIEEIDAAVESGLGYPVGPFTLMDSIGLDVGEAIQRRLHEVNHDPDVKPTAMLTQLIKLGRLGRKTGAGFYAHPRR